ncbi:MAG: sigma-70 family RNA polymerase sigma factor [Myxococcales bacterium FL481]|nr:MAG: sigma-70 family RNA polymerase sigma factor [Myxococcales bacterium FL481]
MRIGSRCAIASGSRDHGRGDFSRRDGTSTWWGGLRFQAHVVTLRDRRSSARAPARPSPDVADEGSSPSRLAPSPDEPGTSASAESSPGARDEPEADATAAPPADASLSPEAQARALAERRDRRLVRRLKQGDERAFRELVLTYQDRVFGLLYRMLGDRQEAEDLAQDVFITVYRAIASYRGEGRFYTWLYRVASNTCKNRIKYLKGRRFHRRAELDDAAHHPDEAGPAISLQSRVPGPEAVVEGNRLELAIQRGLTQLDPDHRLLIVLRDVQGLAYQDIMKITGLAEGTLKSRLHRARVSLRAKIQPLLD